MEWWVAWSFSLILWSMHDTPGGNDGFVGFVDMEI
jgi:hypothetical protein